MRENRVKQKLQSGQTAVVITGHSHSSHTIDFMGPLGFDGFWIEGEHGSVTWDQIGDMTRACDLWGISSIMRIYSSEPGFITRVFDLGMNGIVVPHVNTKADAERIVQAAKFAPVGLRGMYRGRQAFGRPSDYFQQANDETIIIVLIEEIQAVENLSEILTVDHIDVFFVAPGDLAQTMGYIGQPAHPEVQVVIDDALRQIVAAGRVAGALGNEETLGRYASLGVRFFLINYDAWIRQAAQEYLSGVAGLSQPG